MTKLMICEAADRCPRTGCLHKKHHEARLASCDMACSASEGGIKGATCVPYIEPVSVYSPPIISFGDKKYYLVRIDEFDALCDIAQKLAEIREIKITVKEETKC